MKCTYFNILILSILSLVSFSCKDNLQVDQTDAAGKFKVSIVTPQIGYATVENISNKASNGLQANKAESYTITESATDSTFGFTATISTVQESSVNNMNQQGISSTSIALKAATTNTIQTVPNGVYYRLKVFDQLGNLVDSKIYRRGDTGATYGEQRAFELDGGTYTFICYSLMESTLPLIDVNENASGTLNQQEIWGGLDEASAATKTGIDGAADFVYWKNTVNVDKSMSLNIVLKHQFVGLDLTINAPEQVDNYLSLKQPVAGVTPNYADSLSRVRPFASRMKVRLKDASTYNYFTTSANSLGKSLNYPGDQINKRQLVFPTLTFCPGSMTTVNNGEITLKNVVLKAGTTIYKKDITFRNLVWKPGTKYIATINISYVGLDIDPW